MITCGMVAPRREPGGAVGLRVNACALALLGACVLAQTVHAQAQPRAPLPGDVERQFKPPPSLPTVPPRTLPAVPELPPPPPPAPKVRFTVREIDVTGSTVYSPTDFAPHFASLLGREVALDDIYKLAANLTAKYVGDGYFLSRVLVPAQEIRKGTVRLQAIEGYIARVRFQGTRPEDEPVLRAYAEKIQAQRPITTRALERYLLLVNDLAGVEARSTLLASGAGLGAADLVVDFSFTRASGQISADNRGSRALGPGRVTASGELNSLFGRFDKTRLVVSSTLDREQNYVSLFHAQPLGTEGARLAVTAWGAWARPDPKTLGGLSSFDSRSRSVGFFSFYPFIRSRRLNLTGRIGLAAVDGSTEADGMPDTEDRLRVARLGMTFDALDRFSGSNVVDVDLAQGLNTLGATRNDTATAPTPTGPSDFTKVSFYAERRQWLDPNWSLSAALTAQYGASLIPSLERFGFGGEHFGRGYDPSELVGDSGAGLKLDLQRHIGTIGTAAVSGYGFYDLGQVYRRSPPAGEPKRASAAAAGFGLRLRYRAADYAYIELAKPLTRTVALEGDGDARVYGGLFVTF